MQNMTTNRGTIAALVLAGLGALGLSFATSTGPQRAPRSSAPGDEPAGLRVASRIEAGEHRASSTPSVHAGGEPTPPDPKRRLLERHRAEDVEEPPVLRDEGPRPDPTIELHEVQSPAELELPARIRAEQARRLGHALADRAAAVRSRVEDARAEGDDLEAARQARILARLEARTNTLAEHAAIFEAEALEDEGLPGEHEHEHGP